MLRVFATRDLVHAAIIIIAFAPSGCDARQFGARGSGTKKPKPADPNVITPTVVDASHNIAGYTKECAADGNDETYWLVPGGQRMEMMSHDKWLVLDLGAVRSVSAINLLGIVDSFGAARMRLDVGESPNGPWRPARHFRALGTPLSWQRVELAGGGQAAPCARFYRLFVRREGHANFRHRIMGLTLTCEAEEGGVTP